MTQSVRERAKIYTDALRSGRVYGGIEIANFIEELLDQPSPDLSKAVEALKEIGDMTDEDNEWDAVDKFRTCRRRAREVHDQLTKKR